MKQAKQAVKVAGRMPDMSGVAGAIVSSEGLDGLVFGQSKRKPSPYDALLDQLADAKAGQYLRFGDVKARVSVGVRAKKKGLRVSFAEDKGVLYVRFDGRVDDDVRGGRRAAILAALKLGGANAINLAVRLREGGDASVDAPIVSAILTQMARSGEVTQGEGGRFVLNPRAAKAAG